MWFSLKKKLDDEISMVKFLLRLNVLIEHM